MTWVMERETLRQNLDIGPVQLCCRPWRSLEISQVFYIFFSFIWSRLSLNNKPNNFVFFKNLSSDTKINPVYFI